MFARYKGFVYTVKTDTGLGTGFVSDGRLWTCAHVVDGAHTITAEAPGAKPLQLTHVVALDNKLDIAALSPAPGSIEMPDGRPAVMQAAISLLEVETALQDLRRVQWILAPCVLLLAAIVGLLLARRALRPFAQLSHAADHHRHAYTELRQHVPHRVHIEMPRGHEPTEA